MNCSECGCQFKIYKAFNKKWLKNKVNMEWVRTHPDYECPNCREIVNK